MPMVRVSVTLEESVAQAARQSAERRGISLSAWMREAVRKALATPPIRLEERDGRLVAVADGEMPTLMAEMVRETLEDVRR
jgi:Ribbon-helix-helix protein, copG family